MHCDMEVHWHISHFCNFQCVYCFGGRKSRDMFRGVQDVPRIIGGFDRLGRVCQINISGGEPFLYRDFVGLCRKLTEKHCICVNTNLSHRDVYRFAAEIDPGRVRYLNCSLHIELREKRNLVNDYIEKFNFLTGKGFNAFATYVIYPPLLKRFDSDYAFFKDRGVILRPKLFRGTYNFFNLPDAWLPRAGRRWLQRIYPNSLSRRERETILAYVERSCRDGGADGSCEDGGSLRMLNVAKDPLFMDGLPCFKGTPCRTGRDYVRMTPEGEVHRCHGGICRLGNMFDEGVRLFSRPEPCTFDTCRNPYLGLSYVVSEEHNVEAAPG